MITLGGDGYLCIATVQSPGGRFGWYGYRLHGLTVFAIYLSRHHLGGKVQDVGGVELLAENGTNYVGIEA